MTKGSAGPDLGALFAPRSIAVIGASTRASAPPTRLIRTLRATGYEGRIFPVNAKHDTVEGLRSYAQVADLPMVPDLAVIGVGAARVADALGDCARAGIRHVMIISAGFGELGEEGRRLEERVAGIAADSDITLLGPNTMGFANVSDGACVTFSSAFGARQAAGPVAVASQSGGVAGVISELLDRDRVGKSLLVAVGNETGLDLADIVRYAAAREDTAAVCVYAENLQRGERLLDAVETVTASGTGVIVIAAGLSSAGAKAAGSHTGALAQKPFIVRQLLARAGALLADSPQQAASLAAAIALDRRAWPRLPRPARAAVIATSGGYGVLGADAADRQGVELPPFADKTLGRLAGLLPSYMRPGNPVDLPPEVITDTILMKEIAQVVAEDENTDAVAVVGAMRSGAAGVPTATALASGLGALGRPAIAAWSGLSPDVRDAFAAAGMACAESADDVFRVVAHRIAGPGGPRPAAPDTAVASGDSPAAAGLVTEIELKRELASRGITVPAGRVLTSAKDIGDAARALGFPLVAKGVTGQIAHKAAAGLVVLRIESEEDLAVAYQALSGRLERTGAADGVVLAERMVRPGPEIFVGLSRRSAFGDLLMLGAGGGDVEAGDEHALQVARTGQLRTDERRDAFTRAALRSLPAGEDLTAARLSALVDALLRLWEERKDLLQLELNPVIWSSGSLTVVDALAVEGYAC
ncbi:MAG: acetate--CoA ligase family protein [Streptosporangiales bacterium]|nr:acetate--CoA ligase family protein [Streptosporangiales bacterium]